MKKFVTSTALVAAISLGLGSIGVTAASAGTGKNGTNTVHVQKVAIATQYHAAVLAAKDALAQALASATDAAGRQAAHQAFKAAMAAAAAVRANALAALGVTVTTKAPKSTKTTKAPKSGSKKK